MRTKLTLFILTILLGCTFFPGCQAFVVLPQPRSLASSAIFLQPSDALDLLPAADGIVKSVEPLLEQVPSLDTALEKIRILPTPVKIGAALLPLVPLASTLQGWQQFAAQKAAFDKENTYPEATAATYELSNIKVPLELGDAAFVRPLLKQTQLEFRPLQVVYDGNRDGYNAINFHKKVDGKGAAIILCKARGQWFGGYNPRGWASLGGSRPSRASFLFYRSGMSGWQKLRSVGGGGMSCGNDLFDNGIFMGAEALVCPLNGSNPKSVRSRLGTYFEVGPDNRGTLLPQAATDTSLQELKVLTGVYATGEDIPNSGGVLDLGLY